MSKENLMLTLLIPGPKQPGNDIDVYLQPLVEDLKELWSNGVRVYDAYSKSMFNLKAVLMWTINDFPAYGNLSGYSTKGKFACPVCGVETSSRWLTHSKKCVYMCHRRFLAPNHPFRMKKRWFDGDQENRGKPKIFSAEDIFFELKDVVNDWGKKRKKEKKGKKGKKRKKGNKSEEKDKDSIQMWKKKSIFFDLPYWKTLLLRHNLDVMHIEKNICESIIGTLLHVKGKSKDGLKSRNDLVDMGIRNELHPQKRGKNQNYLPPAPHMLSKTEKQIFCKRLADLKLPDGYSSNISNCVSLEECKLVGLKSHDCHVLLHQLLSVALRGLLPKGPRNAIFRLCSFYNEVCQRVIDRNRLEQLEEDVVETLCMFERFFPPSFFDIMVHLTIHLGREARLGGPVQYRWMYPFERYMKVLKGYVRNRARPEGCIAERYIDEECMKFCSGYVKNAAEIGVRHTRNEDFENETILEGRPILGGKPKQLPNDLLQIAHLFVLFNSVEVEPFIEMHLDELKRLDRRLSNSDSLLQKRHRETFSAWLEEKVIQVQEKSSSSSVSNTLKWLARGPREELMSYSGYIINGIRFHTKDAEKSTQNSGVSIKAETMCRSSARDNTQVIGKISYYGIIRDIILLDYNTFRVPIFRCDWANIVNGVKIEDGFTLVNLHEGLSQFERDPFILASHAEQVFYSRDSDTSSWYVVLRAPPRGFHELEMYDETTCMPFAPVDVSRLDIDVDIENESYVRMDCEGLLV
ncbi:hypothetical protein L1049_017761 [Liquidambar formosana]|uniref:Transposase n=1 Tax=Liquidambar formosana TaxID=63359 RepID=A0AAP0X8F0_LIQFO